MLDPPIFLVHSRAVTDCTVHTMDMEPETVSAP